MIVTGILGLVVIVVFVVFVISFEFIEKGFHVVNVATVTTVTEPGRLGLSLKTTLECTMEADCEKIGRGRVGKECRP